MCSPQKSDKNFLILIFLWIKTNVAYTRLEVIAKQRSALQVEFITGIKLICYFVLYYCFLHWAHPPNMAVGNLAFSYTLYLWVKMVLVLGTKHNMYVSLAAEQIKTINKLVVVFLKESNFCWEGIPFHFP